MMLDTVESSMQLENKEIRKSKKRARIKETTEAIKPWKDLNVLRVKVIHSIVPSKDIKVIYNHIFRRYLPTREYKPLRPVHINLVKKVKVPKPIPKTHRHRTRVATFTFDEVKELMSNPTHHKKGKDYGTFDGKEFSLRRMHLILEMGVICKHCNLEGTKFCLETNMCGDLHMDLFSDDDTMMTIDHKVPKSKGGPDSILNYQCLCYPCNLIKGNKHCG